MNNKKREKELLFPVFMFDWAKSPEEGKLMKKILIVITLTVIAIALVGCSGKKETSGSTAVSGGNYEIQLAQTGGNQSGSGWPPANILSQFGMTGMSAPSGVTDLTYSVDENFGAFYLHILFKGNSSTTDTINTWFASNGWVKNDGRNDVIGHHYKGDYSADGFPIDDDNNYVITFIFMGAE